MFLFFSLAFSRRIRGLRHAKTSANGWHPVKTEVFTEETPIHILEITSDTVIKESFTKDPNSALKYQNEFAHVDFTKISNKMKFSQEGSTVFYTLAFVGDTLSQVRPASIRATHVAFRKEDGIIHIMITDSHAEGKVEAYAYDHEIKYVKIGGAHKTFHNHVNQRWRPLKAEEILEIKNKLSERLYKFTHNPFTD